MSDSKRIAAVLPADVPFQRVGHVLGITANAVAKLSGATNSPVPEPLFVQGRARTVRRTSLVEFLSTVVYNCTAVEWLELRKQHDYPRLLTRPQAVKRFPGNSIYFTRFLVGDWPHLVLPHVADVLQMSWRIPPHVIPQGN